MSDYLPLSPNSKNLVPVAEVHAQEEYKRNLPLTAGLLREDRPGEQ